VTDIDGFVLGVDLGTSHTVAMLRHPDGRTRPLLFDGQPLMSSAVYLDTTGRLHAGADAVRLGNAEPGRLAIVFSGPQRFVRRAKRLEHAAAVRRQLGRIAGITGRQSVQRR